MDKNNEMLTQLSLFSDSDTKINNVGKKVEKNMRDQALGLKGCQHIDTHHNCVYNLSEDKGEIKCQIEIIQTGQNGTRITPCSAKCGTSGCIYYTKNNK